MECGGEVSSFDFDRIVAGAQPSGRHALALGVPDVPVADASTDVVTVFGSVVRKDSVCSCGCLRERERERLKNKIIIIKEKK